MLVVSAMDAFRRFIGSVPEHMAEADVIDQIVAHAGVRPQRVLIRNSTGDSNSCFGIVHFHSPQAAAWLSEVGMVWADGRVSTVRP